MSIKVKVDMTKSAGSNSLPRSSAQVQGSTPNRAVAAKLPPLDQPALQGIIGINEIAARMSVSVASPPSRPIFVGVIGTPGIGKSTALKKLAQFNPNLKIIGFGN
jgi:hypothetical protein